LATFKRDLEYLRDRLHAPIVWDREFGAYRLDTDAKEQGSFQLPGLWFNESEIRALLVMEHLLETLQPGLLKSHIGPLKQQIRTLLERGDHSVEEIMDRIRVLPMAARDIQAEKFERIASALLARNRLRITHYSRAHDATTEREISPQRLVHYRDNWYLDAWCHWRKALRTFAVDAVLHVVGMQEKAKAVPSSSLDRELGAGYGIFAGSDIQTAVLRFAPTRARWVAHEHWHSEQRGQFDFDGSYLMEIPYSDPRELIMDILRYGSDVEVVRPEPLRRQVKTELQQSLERYA
jgi:predicted DNA-binding transcriptional regulator YafY